MMVWKEWIGKRIFVQLKSGGVYSGEVTDVDIKGDIVFIEMLDKYNEKVVFVSGEILKIKEEKARG